MTLTWTMSEQKLKNPMTKWKIWHPHQNEAEGAEVEVSSLTGFIFPFFGIYCIPTTRIEASNFQLPLEPLANSDIPLVVIIDLLLLKNITKK